jgi:sulfatase modifying factor 1
VIEATEVTQAEFEARIGYNLSTHTGCADCPVETVNWYEAAAYCNALSSATGRTACYTCTGTDYSVTCSPSTTFASPYDCPGYRLPTEAEWEYAARAGDGRATYNGDLDSAHVECQQPNPVLDPIAWFCGNSGAASHAIRGKTANAWGLFDTLGNVYEFCHDRWDGGSAYPSGAATDPFGTSGAYPVVRGGSWNFAARAARFASRDFYGWSTREGHVGFRPVRSLP